MPERIKTLSEILKKYNSTLNDKVINEFFFRNGEKSKEAVSRELKSWGDELKKSATYNQNTWEQISEVLKDLSEEDIKKLLKDEVKEDKNLINFLTYVGKEGWVPLKPDHGHKLEEIRVNYCFYRIKERKFFMWGKSEEDINSDSYTLGYLAHKELIDIGCLDPERVLKNFKKEE